MFDRKAILYILLGAIIFALVNAWQEDNRAVERYRESMAGTELEHPREAVSGQEKSESERTGGKTKEEHRVTQVKTKQQRYLKVLTDLFEIKINLEGGVLEEAKLLNYKKSLEINQPIVLLSSESPDFYVADSGIAFGPQLDRIHKFTSEKEQYQLEEDQDSLTLTISSRKAGIVVHKIFTFYRGKYEIKVEHEISNRAKIACDGHFYAEISRQNSGTSAGLFKLSTYLGAAVSSEDKPYEKISFAELESIYKNKGGWIRNTKGGWIAMQQRYFLTAWIPEVAEEYRYFGKLKDQVYTVGLVGSKLEVLPGESRRIETKLYLGPEIASNLSPLAKGLDRTVDYGWLWIISVGLFWLLKGLYQLVGNWGAAIILITLLIKLAFYKLSESSGRSMAKMKELMPKLQALKDKYGDDRAKLHQATMDLYQREKVNPMNLGGCLPMLIQIPFFIALYYVLVNAVELRQAPFIFWIKDLSVQDPFYVLPILMGGSMLLQQRFSPSTLDPAQAKMMMVMPVVFTFLFATFPAGLVLYWLANNLLSLLQQWQINRRLAEEKTSFRPSSGSRKQ